MQRTSKCPDCNSPFIAAGNKKRCSACSAEIYRARQAKSRPHRAHAPHSLSSTEVGISDAKKIKQDAENERAAKLWERGMNMENRLK